MKIVIVNGSYRKNGATALILSEMHQQLKKYSFDWLENLSLRFLLVNGTTESVAWCMLFRVSNIVKFLFVYLSLLLVALGILYYFLQKVRVRNVKK